MNSPKCDPSSAKLHHSDLEIYVPPRDREELRLVQLWQELFHVSVGVRDDLLDSGENVSSVNQFILRVQQDLAPHISPTQLQGRTIEELAVILRKSCNPSANDLIVALQPKGEKRPFFLIPGGDGNVFNFYQLAQHLGGSRPVYGFPAYGLDGTQAIHTSIEEMADAYLPILRSLQPRGPYFLGGHCTGSYAAFEMAARLQKQEQETVMLVILDSVAPHLFMQRIASIEQDSGDQLDSLYLSWLVYGFEFWFNKSFSTSEQELQSLNFEEQINWVMKRAKLLNVFPPDAQTEQLHRIHQNFKAMSRIRYMPRTSQANRMVVLRATDYLLWDSPETGWEKWTTNPPEIHDVSGNHVSMLTHPNVEGLAYRLRECFDRAEKSKSI